MVSISVYQGPGICRLGAVSELSGLFVGLRELTYVARTSSQTSLAVRSQDSAYRFNVLHREKRQDTIVAGQEVQAASRKGAMSMARTWRRPVDLINLRASLKQNITAYAWISCTTWTPSPISARPTCSRWHLGSPLLVHSLRFCSDPCGPHGSP